MNFDLNYTIFRVGHIEKLLLIDNLNIDTNELRRACAYGIFFL